MTMHLKETPEDLAVKARLWDATRRELLFFAARYRQEREAGVWRTDAQVDVCAAAKKRGYKKGLVEFLGRPCRATMDEAG